MKPGEEREESERHRRHPDDSLDHMPALVVAELVRKHGFDLVRRQPLEQGVEEHDASRTPESGEECIAVTGAARAVHHVQAAGGESAAGEQRLDPFAAAPAGSGENLLNSGAMTVGYSASTRNWKPIQTAHVQSHHHGPAARINHSTRATSGRPSAAPTSTPLTMSAAQRRQRHLVEAETRLDDEGLPVRERKSTSPEITPIATISARSWASGPPGMPPVQATSTASPPPSVRASSTTLSTSVSMTPKRVRVTV